MDSHKPTALVLGGIKGIGKAIALDLGTKGVKTAINYFDWENSLSQLKEDLDNAGVEHLIMRNNLLEPECFAPMIQKVLDSFGRLDILINNIERGGWPLVHGPYTPEQWDLEMATTLRAKQWAFQAALPHLKNSKNGCVINISSIAGIVGRSGPAGLIFNDGYAAANRGVSSLTETWARQAAPEVRVNEIMLGIFESRHGPGTRGWSLLTDEQKQAVLDHTLLRRTGTLDDVAKAVSFIVFEAPFMTGASLKIDGGYSLGSDKTPEMPPGVTEPGESVFGK